MLPFVLAAVGGYLIGNSIASKEKFSDGGTTQANDIKKLEDAVKKEFNPEVKVAYLKKLHKITGDEKYMKQTDVVEKEIRDMRLKEIKQYVKNQGTLVQEEGFEQVPVHHLSNSIKIKSTDIPYVGADAVYSADGKKLSYSELSDDDIKKIYNVLNP